MTAKRKTRPPHLLVLNGSPHEYGNTMRLAAAFADGLGAGARVVNAYSLSLSPCNACGVCRRFPHACSVRDDMEEIRRHIAWAKIVVVASPLYFTSPTPPLITLFSRLQAVWQAGRHGAEPIPGKKKRFGALLLTAGGKYPDMFEPARRIVAAAMKTIGVRFAGMAGASGLDKHKSMPGKYLAEAEAFGRMFADSDFLADLAR